MTLIRVNPESVRAYGSRAQGLFDEMHRSLVAMVDEVVAVRYFGPNAVAFKTECGRMAAEFANQLHLDLGAMADAVSRSTSNIAASLGGGPVVITVDGRTITAPAPAVGDVVDVDTSALEAQIPAVGNRFEELRSNLTRHHEALSATDWHGNAKLVAVDTVGSFTTAARSRCDEAQRSLGDHMRRQIDAVVAADR